MQYEVPNGAERCFKTPQRIYPRDKYTRGAGLNFQERAEFSGVCNLGPEQLVGCYGDTCCNDGYSKRDFMFMCKDCPYYLGIANDAYWDYSISEPYFIEKQYLDLIDHEHDNPPYFVYFISDGMYVKIGISNNIKKRLGELQVGSPKKLEVLYLIPVKNELSAKRLERHLHNTYHRFSMSGEWFDILGFLRTDDFRAYWGAECFDDITGLVNGRQK